MNRVCEGNAATPAESDDAVFPFRMLSPSPERIIAHSPWRGELFSRAGAPEASGGRPRLSDELMLEVGEDGPA